MGHRLSKIYTKTGDDGSTGLGDGSRVSKDNIRVEAYGTVDEVNSFIGLILTESLPESAAEELEIIQHHLFDLGGELCIPNHTIIKQSHIDFLEQKLDALNDTLQPLKEFILPGGPKASAYTHIARTTCRRAERRIFTLSQTESINPLALKYINRLSDYLFVLARYLAKECQHTEKHWNNQP